MLCVECFCFIVRFCSITGCILAVSEVNIGRDCLQFMGLSVGNVGVLDWGILTLWGLWLELLFPTLTITTNPASSA